MLCRCLTKIREKERHKHNFIHSNLTRFHCGAIDDEIRYETKIVEIGISISQKRKVVEIYPKIRNRLL